MQQTENLNIEAFDPMPTPRGNPRPPAAVGSRRRVGAGGTASAGTHPRRQRSAHLRRGRPLLDPRSGRRPRLRAAPEEAGRRSGRHHAAGDAGVFREAAHGDRLEGLHQRSAHGRFLPYRGRPAEGPRIPARGERTRTAGRHRGARPDRAAIPGRPDRLDRDRRAHLGIADPPRDVVGIVDAGRLQERHRRLARRRGQCHHFRRAARTASSASTCRAVPAWCAPPATATATWCCAAAAGGRTTTRSASRWPRPRWPRPSCRTTSWSIARTPTATRSRNCSRW